MAPQSVCLKQNLALPKEVRPPAELGDAIHGRTSTGPPAFNFLRLLSPLDESADLRYRIVLSD